MAKSCLAAEKSSFGQGEEAASSGKSIFRLAIEMKKVPVIFGLKQNYF